MGIPPNISKSSILILIGFSITKTIQLLGYPDDYGNQGTVPQLCLNSPSMTAGSLAKSTNILSHWGSTKGHKLGHKMPEVSINPQ